MATHRNRSRRHLVGIAALLALLGSALAVIPTLSSPAAAATPAVSTSAGKVAVSTANGFPLWYQDASGLRLQPCLDPADANCVVGAQPNPASPQAFPTNFPDEFFYNQSQSDKLATLGCKGAKPGRVSMLNSLEGAFANGAPAYGDQMVFGRQRLILTGGLCPNAKYLATGPYGSFPFTTDSAGALAKNQATTDVGCAPLAPNTCDFTVALGSPQAKNFITWDPAVAPAAPNGYVGDGTTLHAITGATNNFFSIVPNDPKTPALQQPLRTTQFSVMGKKAGPLQSDPATIDFAGQPIGSTSATRTVTVSALAPGGVTVGQVTKAGNNPGDFSVASNNCTAQTLAMDTGTCQIGVAFAPTGTSGPRTARVVVAHNSYGQPLSIAVSGMATATEAPGISTDVSAIDFGAQRITYSTTNRDVTVTNTGNAPLVVNSASLSGSNSEFSLNSHCTDPVAAGGTCTLTVSFSPASVGSKSATLQISSNAGAKSVTLSGSGFGGRAAVSADRDPNGSFPTWYQDEAGVRLVQCRDPQDAECVVPADTLPDPTAPVVFPTNYPDEYFYSIVDSDTLTTPGCNGTAAGKMLFRFGVEAAFANELPAEGDQMTFGRIRFKSSGGLCPNTVYTAVTPYGTQQLTADAAGALKPSPNTTDVGCAPTAGTLCDFSLALRSAVLGGFLRWDPAAAPAAPAGYVGDPNVLHTIVGAPYSDSTGKPVNYVALYKGTSATGTPVVQTDKFLVMGKLGGPLVASPNPADFGSAKVGDPAVSKTIKLDNTGTDPITVNGFSVTGAAASSFQLGTNGCTSAIAPGGSCNVEVRFLPQDQGALAAKLVVNHTGLNSPMNVALAGVGKAPDGSASLTVQPTALSFADLHTGRTSPAQKLTVSNVGGTAPLNLGDLAITGAKPGSFSVKPGTCTGPVAIDETCSLEVRFTPTSGGANTATLTVNALAPVVLPASRSVSLSGVGFTGDKLVSNSIRDDGFPTYYGDGNGLKLAPCLDPADANCGIVGGPTGTISFPTNYPDEFFYHVADSEPIAVTDTCADGSTITADVSLQEAVEGSFAGAGPEPGQQITFTRSRIIVGPKDRTLCPSATYTFTTPYGVQQFDTDATGALKRNLGTIDTGCGAAPCTFADALAKPTAQPGLDSPLDGVLRWAPGVGADAPAGYLGDGRAFHRVVGGTYIAPGDTEPVNYFEVKGVDGQSHRTDQFSVAGKLAAGLVGGNPVAFPTNVTVGTNQTLAASFTNIGTTPVTVGSAAVTPTNVGFSATSPASGGCVGTVAAGATCTINVRFAPTAAGPASATVQLKTAAGDVLASVPVTGTGRVAAGPRLSVTPTAVSFAATPINTSSAASTVTLRNIGQGTMTLKMAAIGGANTGDFTVTPAASCSSGIAANGTCALSVVFAPTASGAKSAVLTITTGDGAPGATATQSATVTLTGTGTASAIQFKSPSLDMGIQQVGRTVTKTFVITNSGTAPLNLTKTGPIALAGTDASVFSVAPGSCAAAVAPGKNCSINVTFRALAPAGSKSATLAFPGSDAENQASVLVQLTGTSK